MTALSEHAARLMLAGAYCERGLGRDTVSRKETCTSCCLCDNQLWSSGFMHGGDELKYSLNIKFALIENTIGVKRSVPN